MTSYRVLKLLQLIWDKRMLNIELKGREGKKGILRQTMITPSYNPMTKEQNVKTSKAKQTNKQNILASS